MNRKLQLPVKLASLLILIALMATPGVGWGQTETVIYSTGFESSEGFTAGTVYNNTTIKSDGPVGQTWGTYYGTASTTSPISGGQSMQMRWYTTATANLGYTFTEFDLTNVTKVTFLASSTLGLNVSVSYSTDGGLTFTGDQIIILTGSPILYTYNISATGEYENVRVRFIISLPSPSPTGTSRLYLDDVSVYGMSAATPTAATPTFSPDAGTYYSAQNVTLASTTESSTIYYTTDGSDPDNTDTEYTAAIPVSSTTTIKAIAYATGYDPSEIATATYTIVTQFAVTFYVDMSNQTGFTNVDIAGSFNNWGDPVQNMTSAGSGIYTLTTDAIFTAGQNIEFKFRKDGDWGNSEPGSNRTYTVVAGPDNDYHAVYGVMAPAAIGWANLQWPDAGIITAGGTYDVYAKVYMAGVTEPAGQGANISAWIGYSSTNTNPNTWTNWVVSTYNTDDFSNDEYMGTLGAGLAPGTYYYASQFQYSDLEYVYGGYNAGGGNFWDGIDYVSGVLTVNAPPMPNAWINEFHYDNIGADVGEFVEVVVENASGFNLAELRVHLYNGNGGVVYGTSSLDTYTEGATSNNFTIYTLDIPGIQNGSPDGLALSYYNILISGQFLSYEGTFVATDGPAVGVTSVDIGVSENGTGAATNSLQLGGAGTEYSDFYWQPEATNTSGLVNNNQSFFTSTIWNGSVSTAWELSGNWSQGVPVQGMDVQIPDVTNSPVISLPAASDNLTIAPAASVEISSTGSLTVFGDLVTSDGLTVQSGGSLITNGTVTGDVTVIRNIAGLNQYHFISSPISNAALGNVFPAGDVLNIYLREYNEATGNWTNLSIPADLVAGKGYSFFMDIASTTATFAGTLNNADLMPMMSNSGTSGNTNYDGWNLLGNPFASAIQWGLGSWAPINVNDEVHVWSNGVYVSYAGGAGSLTNGIIPAQQGFFVKANNTEPSLTIPTASRLHSSQGFYKNSIADLLRLDVSDNSTYTDATFVRYSYEATEEFDQAFDAHKLDNDEAAPMLYTMHGETRFSINTLKSISETPEVPVYFKAGADGGYTINASGIESFENRIIYLTDLLTGLRQDLRVNPVYAFNASTGDDANRFKLSFATVGIGEQPGLNIGVYAVDGQIRLLLPEAMKGTVNITNLSGQVLYSRNFSASGELGVNASFPAGVYLVSVVTAQGTTTRKVFVN